MKFAKCLALASGLFLVGTAAFASDLPIKSRAAPGPSYSTLPDWNGGYVGGYVGAQQGKSRTSVDGWTNNSRVQTCRRDRHYEGEGEAPIVCSDSEGRHGSYQQVSTTYPGTTGDGNVIGITFGAILGYNKAVNQAVVLGVELDGGYSGARDNEVIYAVTSSHKMPWNANLTGRIILLPTAKQDIGVYLKGGLAIQNQQSTLAGPGGYASANETKAGWTLGGGVEQKIPSWKASARVEAMYSKVSDQTVSIPGASTTLDGRSWNMKAALTWAFN